MSSIIACFLSVNFLFSVLKTELLDFDVESLNNVPQSRRIDGKHQFFGIINNALTNKYFRYDVFNPRDYYSVQKILGLIKQELNSAEVEIFYKREATVEGILNDLSELENISYAIPADHSVFEYRIDENEYIEYIYKDVKNLMNSEIVMLSNKHKNKIYWRLKKVGGIYAGVVNICYNTIRCHRLTETKFYNESEQIVFSKNDLIRIFVQFESQKEYSIMFGKVDKIGLAIKDLDWNYNNLIYEVLIPNLNASRDGVAFTNKYFGKSKCMKWEEVVLEIISSVGCLNEKKIYFLHDEEEKWMLIIENTSKISLTIFDMTNNHAINIVCNIDNIKYHDKLIVEKLQRRYPSIIDSENNNINQLAKFSLIYNIRTNERFIEIMVYDFEKFKSRHKNFEVIYDNNDTFKRFQIVKDSVKIDPVYFILINKSGSVYLYSLDYEEESIEEIK